MTAKNKKKGKQKPPKVKVDLNAGMPKPKPVKWVDPSQLLEGVSNNELLGCWVMEEWEEQGMTPVIVARRQEADRVIYASFLVDFYCLGVKDAYWRSGVSEKAFQRSLPELCFGEPEPCDPGLAHELIYGSIEFARKYGFEPHRDFEKARLLLDPPEVYPRTGRVKFGKDGKPCYVAGPYDNSRQIFDKLVETAGEGNFDYMFMID